MIQTQDVVLGGALLCVSAFFSGSETALFSLPRYFVRRETERGSLLSRLLARQRRLLGVLLVGNMFVNLMYSALALVVAARFWRARGPFWFGLVEVAALAALVLFGEMLPKAFALRVNVTFARLAAPVLSQTLLILGPPALLLDAAAKKIVGLLAAHIRPEWHDHLPEAIDEAADKGVLSPHAAQMLKRLVRLRGRRVRQVLTPRVHVIAFDMNRPQEELIDLLKTSGRRKIPVYDGDIENIRGVLHAKDVLFHPGRPLERLLRPPLFVPETQPLDMFLSTLIRRGATMALVVDEYGSFVGLATLEDAVEEIVGEIEDEHDTHVQPLRILADGRYVLRGDCPVNVWEEESGVRLGTEAATMAGYASQVLGRLPEKGDRFEAAGHTFNVLKAGREGAALMLVERLGEAEGEEKSG